MVKSAKKKSSDQVQPAPSQLTLLLSDSIQRSLMDFIIDEGMKALDHLLEEERTALCGPAHAKGELGDPLRWGSSQGTLTLGGQRVVVRKPRVRQQGAELELPSWAAFKDDDPLNERAVE